MSLKKQFDEKTLNPNTSRNRLKILLCANEVDFSWYLIDKMKEGFVKDLPLDEVSSVDCDISICREL